MNGKMMAVVGVNHVKLVIKKDILSKKRHRKQSAKLRNKDGWKIKETPKWLPIPKDAETSKQLTLI